MDKAEAGRKTTQVLNILEHRRFLYALVLIFPALSMHTPFSWLSFSLFAALAVIALEWKELSVDRELKRILMLLIAYLVIFTALSADVSSSIKGSYDIIRGLIHFPIALLLARYAQRGELSFLIRIAVTVVILAQFLYPQTDFFGFYENPNNVAVMLIFLLSLSLPTIIHSRIALSENLIAAAGLLAGLYLLMLTNSRAAWLGCAVAAGVLVLGMRSLSARKKVALVALVACALLSALYFLNWKGFELRLRDVIWEGLFRETLNTHPWLGYGINYARELMPTINVPFSTTHNLFLELFVSSGFIGLVIMLYIFFRLARHYFSFRFERFALFYAGVFGLVAFLVMDQFDLKFASYRFFGSHCFFLGLIYAHRVKAPAPREKGGASR